MELGYITERINENIVNFALASKNTLTLKEVNEMATSEYFEYLIVFNKQAKKHNASNSSERNR